MTKLTRKSARNQEGQALIEMALVLPMLLLLVMGIIQFGFLFNNYITLTDSVRVGARQAAVSRMHADPDGTTKDRVRQAAHNLDHSKLDITVEPYDPNSGSATWVQGGDVTVTATYPYSINLLGFTVMSGTLKSKTIERVE